MIKSIKNKIIYLYLIVILGILPLYMRAGYSDIGDRKYNLFFMSSAILFCILLVLTIAETIIKKESIWKMDDIKDRLSEMSVYSFFVAVLISFLVSPYKEYAIVGAYDWYMGLVAQIIFFASYMFISYDLKYKEWILYVMYAASAIVFLVGVLNRFDIDVFAVYEFLNNDQKLMFLSTIGQTSWYSGYLCIIFPIAIYDYYIHEGRRKICMGIYLVIVFITLVTQNTDSAYIALLGVLLVLLYKASKNKEGMLSFAKVIMLMFGSFIVTGLLQTVFKKKAIMPEKVSVMMTHGFLPILGLLLSVILYVIVKRNILGKKWYKRLFWIALGVSAAGLVVWVAMIILNTTGIINPQIDSNYLIWNDTWGNYRGVAWNLAIKLYCSIGTVWGYLFGVGPDCFYVHSCFIPQLADYVEAITGDVYYANAHNDYLTILVNYGAIGLLSYIAMLVMNVKMYIKSKNMLVVGIAASIVAYSLHNIFCYQEVCNAPFFYIFLGIGNNLLKNEEK